MPVDNAQRLVLVVDDETIILWGTASLLESLGYRALRANTGRAALEALRERPEIGAVLTDFQMPKMSGVELAEAARQLRPNLPVVIATGHPTLQGSQGRPWVTLAKPFTREELGDAVRRAFDDN
jgi:DNA-binding NtrC family response regulator